MKGLIFNLLDYIYDGSFEGLLTAVFEAKYRHEVPSGFRPRINLQQSLFQENIHIPTDTQKADRVYTAIKKKLSYGSLENIYYVYLSEIENSGRLIFDYLDFGWTVGKNLDLFLTDDRVLKIHNISRKVTSECHRMLGLIRFRQLSHEIFYSPVELDYNILSLIAPHFASRFSDQNWIIHDKGRGLAAIYNQTEWVITEVDSNQLFNYTESECEYQNLWKKYFKSIAISSRVNPALQRKNMPARYWSYLIEKHK